MFQRIEVILTPSIALETIARIIMFSRRGSHCSARGGVAAEGTSCVHGTKECSNPNYFHRPVSRRPSQALEIMFIDFQVVLSGPAIKTLLGINPVFLDTALRTNDTALSYVSPLCFNTARITRILHHIALYGSNTRCLYSRGSRNSSP